MGWRWKAKATNMFTQSRYTLSLHFRRSLEIGGKRTGAKWQPETEENGIGTDALRAFP